MPTLDFIEGFEHRVLSALKFAGGDGTGIWDGGATDAAFSYVSGRNGQALRLVETGAAVCYRQTILPTTRTRVGSLYVRAPSDPAAGSRVLELWNPSNSTFHAHFFISSGGAIQARAGNTGTIQTGPDIVASGGWHLLDFYANTTANPWVLKWAVDGVAQTDATEAAAAGDTGSFFFGTRQSVDVATCEYDDAVFSATAADYPIGAHDVLFGVPTGDGTHNAGTNIIEDTAGTDIVSPNAFPLLDEVPATTADYIRQFAVGASNYAEVTFDNEPASKTIWGVSGFLAGFASSTTASADGTTRIVDSAGNTLTDIYAGDMSETALNYRRAMITAPAGGWDSGGYSGVKARVGFSSTVTSQPRWAALMLQYAVTDAVATTRRLQVTASPRRW